MGKKKDKKDKNKEQITAQELYNQIEKIIYDRIDAATFEEAANCPSNIRSTYSAEYVAAQSRNNELKSLLLEIQKLPDVQKFRFKPEE